MEDQVSKFIDDLDDEKYMHIKLFLRDDIGLLNPKVGKFQYSYYPYKKVRIFPRDGYFWMQVSSPFIKGGNKRKSTGIRIDIQDYFKHKANLEDGSIEWWQRSLSVEKIVELVNALQDEILSLEIDRINQIINSPSETLNFSQNKYIYRFLRNNESWCRYLLTRTKLITLLPLVYVDKLIRKFDNQLHDKYLGTFIPLGIAGCQSAIRKMRRSGAVSIMHLNRMKNSVPELFEPGHEIWTETPMANPPDKKAVDHQTDHQNNSEIIKLKGRRGNVSKTTKVVKRSKKTTKLK